MDVAAWLRGLALEQYAAAFHENGVDTSVLPALTADDLKDIGITAVGHRREMLDAIAALRGSGGEPIENPVAAFAEAAKAPLATERAGAERRQLAVLFCDLTGSTALSSGLDPEDLREVMTAYHQAVSEAVRHQGGYVAKFLGDGVLAYFGWPQGHEDDPERAVRAGLAAVAAVGGLSAEGDRFLTV
jgi:class 3 adenylate cyclase